MIIPIQCKTCGKMIAHQWFDYIELVKEYQREAQQNPELQKPDAPTPEKRALNKLNIERYCCRIMFLCNVDLSDIIQNRLT